MTKSFVWKCFFKLSRCLEVQTGGNEVPDFIRAQPSKEIIRANLLAANPPARGCEILKQIWAAILSAERNVNILERIMLSPAGGMLGLGVKPIMKHQQK